MPEKRRAGSYEITQRIAIGDREVVLGVDEKNEIPYICAFYTDNGILGAYTDCMVADNYVEIVELFAERVKEQCVKIREEQEKITVPREIITADMCLTLKGDENLEGKVVAVRAESIRPEYRSAEHQLIFVTGGFGARGGARGRACFCRNLYSGKRSRWDRCDIQGEVKPEYLPEWAKECLVKIQETEKAAANENKGISSKEEKAEEREGH